MARPHALLPPVVQNPFKSGRKKENRAEKRTCIEVTYAHMVKKKKKKTAIIAGAWYKYFQFSKCNKMFIKMTYFFGKIVLFHVHVH